MGYYNAIAIHPSDPDTNLYFTYESDNRINTRGCLLDAYHEGICLFGFDILVYAIENITDRHHATERRYDLQLGNYGGGVGDRTRLEVMEWNRNWCRRSARSTGR